MAELAAIAEGEVLEWSCSAYERKPWLPWAPWHEHITANVTLRGRPDATQGPLSRFGDTAANSGTLAVLDSYESTATLPVAVKTLAASAASASFRIVRGPASASYTPRETVLWLGYRNYGDEVGVPRPVLTTALVPCAVPDAN